MVKDFQISKGQSCIKSGAGMPSGDVWYHRPVMLSKRQVHYILKGRLITIRRKGKTLHVALKGYSDEAFKIKEEIAKLKEKLKRVVQK